MLSSAYILPDPCTPGPPDRFRPWPIYIFHLTRSLIQYGLPLQKSIAQPKASAFPQSTGLQPSLTWIERYGDERIGCAETIAVGERFLAARLNMFT